ncbi:MAG: hypothetical protein ABW321_31865 [Polyangiales bacterium]
MKLIDYYARKTGAQAVLAILAKGGVSSDAEAQALLAFLDVLGEAVREDAQNNAVVLEGERVDTSDAVKVSEVVERHLDTSGYGHLLPDDE